jgi:hypothetical protein
MAKRGFPQERNEAHGFRKGGASVSASDVIARLRELRAKAHFGRLESKPWDDEPNLRNVIAPDTGALLAVELLSEDAAAIVAAMNSLESLLACESALQRLSFMAQTSGGTAGRDEALVAAIAEAAAALQALAEGGGE